MFLQHPTHFTSITKKNVSIISLHPVVWYIIFSFFVCYRMQHYPTFGHVVSPYVFFSKHILINPLIPLKRFSPKVHEGGAFFDFDISCYFMANKQKQSYLQEKLFDGAFLLLGAFSESAFFESAFFENAFLESAF